MSGRKILFGEFSSRFPARRREQTGNASSWTLFVSVRGTDKEGKGDDFARGRSNSNARVTRHFSRANIHSHRTVAIDYTDVSRIRASPHGASATLFPSRTFSYVASRTTVSPRVSNTMSRIRPWKPILRQLLMFPPRIAKEITVK